MRLFPRFCITAVLSIALMYPSSLVFASNVSSTTLPNGMRVIVREGHTINLAAIDIWVRAGSVNESAENNGISHFVEHMLFKSTQRYGPGQIDREIEGLGAELNGGTSKDWVHFYTTVASEYLPNALDVLADAVMNPQFRPDEIEKERQVIMDEIARSESNASQRALNLFAQTAFAEHPYRLAPMGNRESIARITRDDLVSYYNKHYTPENICVVIAGDVKASDVIALVERTFAGFTSTSEKGSAVFAPQSEVPPSSVRVRRYRSATDKAYVVLGYHVGSASDFREVAALDVALVLIGDTYRGRVSGALNAAGIPFGVVTTDFITQRYPTTFSVLVSVEPKDVDKIGPLLIKEFQRLATEQVTPAELEHAKRLVEGSDLFEQETFSGQARALGIYELVATHDLALKYGATVRGITAADVLSVARKYFTANCCIAIIEPEQSAQ